MAREKRAGFAGVCDVPERLDPAPRAVLVVVVFVVVVFNANDHFHALGKSAHQSAKGFRTGRAWKDKTAFNDAIAALEICAVALPDAAFHFLGLRFLAVLAAALKAPLSG